MKKIFKKNRNLKRFYQLVFVFTIIAYFLIGINMIQQVSLASDEPAYIGASYAYTQGVGINQEHPLLLKLLNASLFKLLFSQIDIDALKILAEQSIKNQPRLDAFILGYNVIVNSANFGLFDKLVFSSRFIYLFFNSLLLLWLYIYGFIFKLINPKIATFFAIFFVFSPSFYSHSALVSFDVSVAIGAFLTAASLAIAVFSIIRLSDKYIYWQFVIIALSLFIAINTKFSNVILIPVVVATYGFTFIYLMIKKQNLLAKKFIFLGLLSLLVQPIFIFIMYRIAFASLPNQSIIDTFNHYIQGVQMTLSAAGGSQAPFLDGQFVPVNYFQYVSKIFWLKENPILFLIAGFILFNLTKTGLTRLNKQKKAFAVKQFILNHKNVAIAAFVAIISIYPIIYTYFAYNSHFVLGYRYFYPVLIFIYFLIAVLALSIRHKYYKRILGIGLALYVLFGILGVSQNLSYVNFFWRQDKWLLTNDSTLNWGQENRNVVEYLLSNNMLPKINKNTLIYQTFGVVINVNQYLDFLSRNDRYPLDIQSYYRQPPFQPLKSEIKTLPHQYLLIDSTAKQTIYAERQNNTVAAANWEFIKNNKPIYSHNDIIFIYQLH